ncbi:restriction endonuclease subunit S [Gilliamella sp. Bif1-4]|uniref:restriction endonuclease subunit S n=1 Tax=Gilliamella sp. Bif1-4 TaxID=3120233 RepID=UPI00080E093C|nr:restriction endonuclease subunit S [Gilliamella apicola]OCG42696.1 hypothetical protein A9G25_01445 [Gilliamella apicola]
MSESKKLIPRRRFKEFEANNNWLNISLKDVTDSISYGLNVAAKNYDGFNKYLRITDIDDESREFKKDSLTSPNIEIKLANNYKLQIGDILFARTGASVGKTYRYKESDGHVYYAGFLIRLRLKSICNSEFIYQNTLSKRYKKFIQITSQRSGQPGVNANEYSNFVFATPNLKEQTQIGEFFKKLDKLINTQQKKLEKAKTLKSAYLTEMFPNEGELKPRYRFLGFKKDWSITQFKNLANIRRGLTYTPSNLALDGVRILRSSNIDSDRFILRNDDIFIDQSYVSISLVKENDILITSANGSSRLVGKHALIKITNNEKAVHGGFMLLATSNQPFFTNAIMSSNWYRKFLNTYVAGGNGAIGNLNKTELANQDISIPTTLEQTQIGNFFKLLDNKIALEQKKLDKLKNIKQAYLNEMFV